MDYILGDNESMINSLTTPEAKLHKQHNISMFHYVNVRSMISQRYTILQHLASRWNFDNISTKNWSYQRSHHELIQPVFHHSRNTAALFPNNTLEVDVSIAEGSIFGILGSDKSSSKPQNGTHVCG